VDFGYLPVQQPESDKNVLSRFSMHTVWLLYRQQIRRWSAITAPTSPIASFVLSIADRIQAIDRTKEQLSNT